MANACVDQNCRSNASLQDQVSSNFTCFYRNCQPQEYVAPLPSLLRIHSAAMSSVASNPIAYRFFSSYMVWQPSWQSSAFQGVQRWHSTCSWLPPIPHPSSLVLSSSPTSSLNRFASEHLQGLGMLLHIDTCVEAVVRQAFNLVHC